LPDSLGLLRCVHLRVHIAFRSVATDLGRSIVYAPDPETEGKKKIEAFLSIDLFKRVLEHYKGSELPEMKYLGNTLENVFKLQPSFHEEFSKVFRENTQELGITSGAAVTSTEGSGAQPSTVVVGLPKGGDKNKPKAFVIMPFIEKGTFVRRGSSKRCYEAFSRPLVWLPASWWKLRIARGAT
jgi:hypothetical protein